MKSNKGIVKLTEKHVFGNYGRFPIALVKGKGVRVWDKAGKVYLDFLSGVAVNSLGHCHPKVVAAIRRQAGRLIHVSNHYHIEEQSQLAAELTRLSFADKVFFCNSGTEANEAAIKLARRCRERSPSRRGRCRSGRIQGRTVLPPLCQKIG